MRVRLGSHSVIAEKLLGVSCHFHDEYLSVYLWLPGAEPVNVLVVRDAIPACRDFLVDWGFGPEVERMEVLNESPRSA